MECKTGEGRGRWEGGGGLSGLCKDSLSSLEHVKIVTCLKHTEHTELINRRRALLDVSMVHVE